MEWKNAGAELPPEWKDAVSAHFQKMLGKRGLGRFAWCVAAEILLCLPPDELREMASNLRHESESDPGSFAEKWSDPPKTSKRIAAELRPTIDAALKSRAGLDNAKRRKKT